jgi:hypothetical protein
MFQSEITRPNCPARNLASAVAPSVALSMF